MALFKEEEFKKLETVKEKRDYIAKIYYDTTYQGCCWKQKERIDNIIKAKMVN